MRPRLNTLPKLSLPRQKKCHQNVTKDDGRASYHRAIGFFYGMLI